MDAEAAAETTPPDVLPDAELPVATQIAIAEHSYPAELFPPDVPETLRLDVPTAPLPPHGYIARHLEAGCGCVW